MNKIAFPILLLGTVVMIGVMAVTGAGLKTAATPKGILDLEFAYNTSKAEIVLDAWRSGSEKKSFDNISVAMLNTKLDFIFLFFYSLFLYSSCKGLSVFFSSLDRAKHAVNFLKTTGAILANAAIVAGLLDILENIGMLFTLSGHLSDSVTMFTVVCSAIKWLLALLAVVYVLIAGAIWMLKKLKYIS